MKQHMPCYGKLFRSTTVKRNGKERGDAVFGFAFAQPGTVALPPEVTVDVDAWDRCIECQEFAACQQLSTSKVLLEMAVR